MPEFVPHDPLRNYAFRVILLQDVADSSGADKSGKSPGGEVEVAGVQKVLGLTTSIAVLENWSGGNLRHSYKSPDRASWDAITLEQGLALNNTLEIWAKAALDYVTTGAIPTVPVKRNLFIDVYDPELHPKGTNTTRPEGLNTPNPNPPMTLAQGASRAKRFAVYNACVSKYVAMPAFDAMGGEVALLSVEITHEGFREVAVPTSLART